MTDETRLEKLEILVSHLSSTVEDLNEVVSRQSSEIDVLTRRVALLMQRAAEQEADGLSGIPLADQKPPHY